MQVPDSAKWQTPGESGLEKVDPQGKNVSRGFEREPIHVAGAERWGTRRSREAIADQVVIAFNNLTSDRRRRNPRDSLDASKPPLSEPAVGNVTATSLFNFESGRSCYSVTQRVLQLPSHPCASVWS